MGAEFVAREEAEMEELSLMAMEHQRQSYHTDDSDEDESLFRFLGLHHLLQSSSDEDEAENGTTPRRELRHDNLSAIEELDDLESESTATSFLQHLNSKFSNHDLSVDWGDDDETVSQQHSDRSSSQQQQGENNISLPQVISQSLLATIAVYGTAAWRELVRTEKVEGDLAYPTSLVDQIHDGALYAQDLKESSDLTDTDFYVSALTNLADDFTQKRPQSIVSAGMMGCDPLKTLVFDDNTVEGSPAYSINVDTTDKALIVAFRGGVAVQDWMANSRAQLYEVTDPRIQIGLDAPEFHAWKKASKVGVHRGFRDSLFALVDQGPDGEKTTKYKVILEHLRSLLDVYVGYSVHVTGHSVGGAVATLFSFYAACEEWMPPVTCTTFGSPRVGNLQFLKSFRKLEEDGRLQHLRIVNHLDPVPMLPHRLVWYGAFLPNANFRHVGIELRLFSHNSRKTKSFYSPQDKGILSQCAKDLWAATRHFVKTIRGCTLDMHRCQIYLDRLDREIGDLSTITMNDLYKDYRGEQVAAKFENETAESQVVTTLDHFSEVSC